MQDVQEEYPLLFADEDAALQRILKGTAAATGEPFFAALVKNLAENLNTYSAWVTEYIEPSRHLRSLAFWAGGRLLPNFNMPLEGTPCQGVIDHVEFVHYPDNVLNLFPNDHGLIDFQAVSYMGVPLLGDGHRVLGNLAVLDTRPMPRKPRGVSIMKIFAARAAAELQRMCVEADVHKREEKYRRIIETTGEGFLLMNKDFVIFDVNHAFCSMVGYGRQEVIGKTPLDFSTDATREYLRANKGALYRGGPQVFEGDILSRNGAVIPVLVHSNILLDDHGESIGKVAFITDMTAHKKSLALAAEVQRSLLPRRRPAFEGFDIGWKTVSCDEVGGDYIDFFDGKECGLQQFSLAVGDMMGHGVDAALMMTSARAFLRIHAAKCGGISDLITDLNFHFAQDALLTSRFMTLFYLCIDASEPRLRWVRAGHEPALIYDPQNGVFDELKGAGMALGIDDRFRFTEYSRSELDPGRIIAVGTDGVWEARNHTGEMYGKQRFCDVIRGHADQPASEIVDAVFADLADFTVGCKQEDDITLVIIKVEASAGPAVDYQI